MRNLLLVTLTLFGASVAFGAPITITGTILNPGDADHTTLTSILGAPPDPNSDALIAFDLASLGFDPLAILLIDDGTPTDIDFSGLGGTGLDVDAVGGLSASGGTPTFASSVDGFVPGQRIDAPSPSFAQDLDPFLNAPGYANRTAPAPGGTGGPGFLFGTSDDALGAPDGIFPLPGGGPLLPEGGWVSIGGGGMMSLSFATPIDRNGNIGGTIYDLVYYDFGGAGDGGFFQVDDQIIDIPTPMPSVPLPSTVALLGVGLAAFLRDRRKA